MASHVTSLRILVDLSFAHRSMGFSGIPQDSRLLFNGLSESGVISPTGLIAPNSASWTGSSLLGNLEEQSVFLGSFLNGQSDSVDRVQWALSILSARLGKAYQRLFKQGRTKYSLAPLLPEMKTDLIWRSFFQSTIPPSRKQEVMGQDFCLSVLGLSRMVDAALRLLPVPSLDTSNFDFVIFQDSRVVSVGEATQKIIRYHDGIPIFESDTSTNEWLTRLHYNSIMHCSMDSIYVCNSPSAQSDLAKISPQAGDSARVIPYFVPRMSRVEVEREALLDIALTRVSSSTSKRREGAEAAAKWFAGAKGNNGIPRYIMSLATVEPRKNYQGLISAWRKLRLETGEDIRLMIVGSPGWKYEPILAAMRPYVMAGQLLHLETVLQEELPYLYSSAACFVFPSFAEGFGLPPTEAMQCGCPVIVSDIPAHRYSAGDAALYVNPYDVDDIAAKLRTLLVSSERDVLREDLIARGYKNVDRFSVSSVLPQWESLFEGLKASKKPILRAG